jgi:nucleoside-diphosphate-sugar epimerase
MKVLVTGHEGYIGSVLCPLLVARGHTVVGLDIGYFSDYAFLPPEGDVPRRRRDVRDLTAEDLAGIDAVIHLAALSNDPMGQLDPSLTAEINHRGSVRLAELARRAGVTRFVFSSSCSTYGAAQDRPLDETAPFNPVSAYAISKVGSERDIAALARDDFSPTFMRNATAYGVSPRMRTDLVVNNFVGWAVTTGQIRILSDGTPWRPVVHIRDIAAAMAAVLEVPHKRVHNVAFNVGRDEDNYQVREIADVVASTVPGSTVVYAGTGEPDKRSYRVDFGKIKRELPEFRPAWDVRKGAAEIYEAFRLCKLDRALFEGRHLVRLAQLRYLLETAKVTPDLRWADAAEMPA